MKKIIFLWIVLAVFFESCKKDNTITIEQEKIELIQTKKFYQIAPPEPQQSWYLVLRLDGTAAIAPGMDTMENGTYNTKDNLLIVKTNRDVIYEFEILSETDLKLNNADGILLRWKKLN